MRKFLRTVRFFGLASSLVVAMAVDASAALTTITFDGAPTGPDVTFQEGGYTISVSGASIQNIGSPNNNVLVGSTPTNVFGNFTTITKTGGGTFSLVSL